MVQTVFVYYIIILLTICQLGCSLHRTAQPPFKPCLHVFQGVFHPTLSPTVTAVHMSHFGLPHNSLIAAFALHIFQRTSA